MQNLFFIYIQFMLSSERGGKAACALHMESDHLTGMCKTSMSSCRRTCIYVDNFVIDLKGLTMLRMFSPHTQ
jgi:hypothetical protein